MKTFLKVSLLANLGLVAMVLWLTRHPGMEMRNDSASPVADVAPGAPAVPQVPASASPREHQLRFQWSQLESTDYRTYIANLREIGCPPQTVRDIIVADVASVFAERREQLMRQHIAGGLASSLSSPNQLQFGLQHLQNEETSLLQTLLGPPSSSSNSPAADAPALTTQNPVRRNRLAEPKPELPLAFQNPGPEFPLNPTQVGVIANLRESFNEELSGLNLDPADPEYHRRWQAAQRDADEKMSALLGSDFTQKYQIESADPSPSKK